MDTREALTFVIWSHHIREKGSKRQKKASFSGLSKSGFFAYSSNLVKEPCIKDILHVITSVVLSKIFESYESAY